jgi:Sel1 repeat
MQARLDDRELRARENAAKHAVLDEIAQEISWAQKMLRPQSGSEGLPTKGNTDAQAMLGALYADGAGVRRDYVEATKWLHLAADQGNDLAQFGLGRMYYSGQGAAQDYAEAAKWFRKAADQGNVNAQARLASMYFWGQGVPQDDADTDPKST